MPYKNLTEQRAYQRIWMAQRRATFFSDKSCARCGSTEDLELDHIDPGQKVTHRIWSWAPDKFNEEAAKCQVLCFGCHRLKTRLERLPRRMVRHGTKIMYSRPLGCRCDDCKEANNEINRRYKVRLKARLGGI